SELATLEVSSHPFYGELTNSIVWGDLADEFLGSAPSATSETQILANLLKTADTTRSNNIYNKDPLFIDPIIFQYELDSLSPAINQGIKASILTDLNGAARDNQPDLGAYEYQK
ncbi:MAG: choice-of-anchor Q domain-containing protein, partial [Bacteroidota bacterium]